jgi:phospholipid-binding lipoprotein MlaA
MRNISFSIFFFLCCSLAAPVAGEWGRAWADDAAAMAASPGQDELFSDPFDEGQEEIRIADPIEPVNRAFFWFNDKLYFYVLKPVARTYRIVPETGRVAVGRFFSNLSAPVRFVNSLLQLKMKDAGSELGRFCLNTTVGLGGLLEPAKTLGLDRKEEDFGQTLGYYGVGQGFYLVIPFWGASSLRDGIGDVADRFLLPQTYVLSIWEGLGATGLETVNFLSLDKDTYESIRRESLDPYLFIRNAYAQRREGLIKK